jgi:hypothetical protein
MNGIESVNFQTFRDCLAAPLVQKSTNVGSAIKRGRKARRVGRKTTALQEIAFEEEDSSVADELAEFIDVRTILILIKEAEN